MSSFSVKKRTSTKSISWMYDVRHENLKSGKKRKSGFKTKKAAEHAAMELISELNSGNIIDEDKTFSEYFIEWIDANNKKSLSKNQYGWYKRSLTLFNEYFGDHKRLNTLNKQQYQKFLNHYGEGRTDESVRKVHGCISACLRDAVYDGYIKKDPTYKISARGSKDAKPEEAKYMNIKDYLSLIDYFKSKQEQSYLILYIISITGARFGEVYNLELDDIMSDRIHLPGTKTKNANRVVEVSKEDVLHIKKTLMRYPKRIDGRLFTVSYNAVKKAYNKAKEKVEIEDEYNMSMYALRHTHCSYLLSQGISIEYISKRLGHFSISMTLDTYSHLLDEYKEKQGQKVRDIFSSLN